MSLTENSSKHCNAKVQLAEKQYANIVFLMLALAGHCKFLTVGTFYLSIVSSLVKSKNLN